MTKSLSEQIRTIVHAFDSGDSRRDDILRIADRVERLEKELHRLRTMTAPWDEHK